VAKYETRMKSAAQKLILLLQSTRTTQGKAASAQGQQQQAVRKG
jgi:hypothetical protein